MNEWWSDPVRVAIDGSTALNVNSNEQAARMMLAEDWPGEESPRQLRARQTILRSMEKAGDPGGLYAARTAFEAAAREANILLGERPKSMAPKGFKSPGWSKRR